jgi:hypothetical protein
MLPLVMSLSGLVSVAAFAAPPFEVDDPATVGQRSLELFAFYGLRDASVEMIHSLPGIAVSYGISDTTELSVGAAPIYRYDTTERWGVSDIHVRLKQRVREEGRIMPALSAAYQLTIVSGSNGLPRGDVNHNLLLIAGHQVGQGSLHVNLGVAVHPEADRFASLTYGIGYIQPLSERVKFGAELIGQTSRFQRAGDDLAWGVAVLYEFAANRSLAIRVGRAERGEAGVSLSLGLVLYFPN